MEVHLFDSMNELSEYAANAIASAINRQDNPLLCTATGNSTTETYSRLVQKGGLFSVEHLRIIKLDEWGGVPDHHPMTCEAYLQEKLIRPLKINPAHYISFRSDPPDPARECERIQHLLDAQGPIDLCILGIGLNGHIAFNEPAESLIPHCHQAALTPSSLSHPMAREMDVTPCYGLTLGMADILQSKKILLLISGKSKAAITRSLMQKRIDTRIPASLLWLHPDVQCLCDREACVTE